MTNRTIEAIRQEADDEIEEGRIFLHKTIEEETGRNAQNVVSKIWKLIADHESDEYVIEDILNIITDSDDHINRVVKGLEEMFMNHRHEIRAIAYNKIHEIKDEGCI